MADRTFAAAHAPANPRTVPTATSAAPLAHHQAWHVSPRGSPETPTMVISHFLALRHTDADAFVERRGLAGPKALRQAMADHGHRRGFRAIASIQQTAGAQSDMQGLEIAGGDVLVHAGRHAGRPSIWKARPSECDLVGNAVAGTADFTPGMARIEAADH